MIQNYLEKYPLVANKVLFVDFGDELQKRITNLKEKKYEEIKNVVYELVDEILKKQPLLLSTHLILNKNDEYCLDLKLEQKLNCGCYIHLVAKPEFILERRKKDKKESLENLLLIDLHQKASVNSAKILSEKLNCNFYILENNNEYDLKKNILALDKIIKKEIYP